MTSIVCAVNSIGCQGGHYILKKAFTMRFVLDAKKLRKLQMSSEHSNGRCPWDVIYRHSPLLRIYLWALLKGVMLWRWG